MELSRLDLNLLVVLDALLREQNVTRAAEGLHMSQPAVSAALARLRRTLDDPLLVKSGRELRLSPRAESLVEPVRDVLATIEHSILRPHAFDPATDTRTFSVLASDYVDVVALRPLLGRLHRVAPRVRLDLRPAPREFRSLLRRDEVDLAVMPDSALDDRARDEYAVLPLLSDRLVGAVWSRHPAAPAGVLDVEVLRSWPYLMVVADGVRAFWERELDRRGLARRVEASMSSFTTLPFMLAETDLVTILPARLAHHVAAGAGITLLEPAVDLPPLRHSLLWHVRRETDAGHRWLRDEILAAARADERE